MFADQFTNESYSAQGLQNSPFTQLAWSPEPRAILYIFTPVATPNEIRRSHVYNFRETNFINNLGERLTDPRGDSFLYTGNDYENEMSRIANNSVQLSSTGETVFTDWLRSSYTFILIADNDFMVQNLSALPKHFPNRMLYSGYFLDEPVNPTGINGRVSVNENCMMQILHHTYLRVKHAVTPRGALYVPHVEHDRDIIVPHLIDTALENCEAYLLDPFHVSQSQNYDPDTSEVTMNVDNARASNYYDSNLTMPTNLKIPKRHLQTLVNPLFGTANSLYNQPLTSTLTAAQQHRLPMVSSPLTTANFFQGNAATAYRNVNPTVTIGLDPTRMYSIGDVIARYNNTLKIQPCRIPFELPIDISDMSGQTPVEIATSLITTNIPPLMVQCGIGTAVFTYTSETNPLISSIDGNWTYQLEILAPIIPEPENQVNGRWDTFLGSLRNDTFEVIRQMFGDFEVYIAAQGSGMCNVQLHLFEFGEPEAWTVSNQLIGGITTPLVGNEEVATRNTTEFSQLIPSVTHAVQSKLNYNNGLTL